MITIIVIGVVLLFLIRYYQRRNKIDSTHYYKVIRPFAHLNYRINDYRIIVAPASGPRGIITMGFDRQFVNEYRPGQSRWLIGGSTAALRFVAVIATLLSGVDRSKQLQQFFTNISYRKTDTQKTLTRLMNELIDTCAPVKWISAILRHPELHLCFFVVRFFNTNLSNAKLRLVMAQLFISNLRNKLHTHYEPIVYYTGTQPPPFITDPHVRFVRLTETNYRQVLLATTCIPFLSEHVNEIDDSTGTFLDGAFYHYHFNIDNSDKYPALYLGDEIGSVKRNVMDYFVPWRQVSDFDLRNCTRIFPTDYYRRQLPNQRFPRVSDWFDEDYIEHPERRQQSWNKAYELSLTHWKETQLSSG